MGPNPEGGAQLWGEGPADTEMPNMEDGGEDGEAQRYTRENVILNDTQNALSAESGKY